METSPVPLNVEIGGVPAPAVAGGAPATVVESVEPNNTQINVGSTTLYDTTANPLVLSPLGPGAMVTVSNFRAVAIKVKSANAGDPGVIVPALSTFQFGFDPIGAGGGFINLIGGGASGSTGNQTYSVATLAARPALTAVPNGTWVYVQSQKSWYWSGMDTAGNPVWLRLVVPNDVWMAQAAWGIDTVNGNDENVGSVASPLRTWFELTARLPALKISTTVTVAAASALGSVEWQPVVAAGSGISITIQGTRVLGVNNVVASSSDETATQTPRVDAGVPLTIGSLIQVTVGATANATAVVGALIGGTNYATSPWRTAGGARAVPPAPGDSIASFSAPTASFWSVSVQGGTFPVRAQDLTIAAVDDCYQQFEQFRTCWIQSALFLSLGFYTFDGSSIQQGGGQNTLQGPNTFFQFCAFVGAGPTAFDASQSGTLNDTIVCGGGTLIVRNNAFVNANRLGLIGAAGVALQVIRGGFLRVNGTLYGSGAAGNGTEVTTGAKVGVNGAVTPTLAAGGQQLILDNQATAIPPLAGGAGVPAASALTTWAQWAGAPFNRNVIGYQQGAAGSMTNATIFNA